MTTAPRTITVCVGSSCHIKGARQVITRFDELLKRYDLDERVKLKGSFCMERCGEGVNWQIDDEPRTSGSVEEAVEMFRNQVLEPLGIRPDDEPRTPERTNRKDTEGRA
ncbi:MAG: (2Fe-2S) ferredoxin domain-containing protein [Planctomycetota bacterium]